MCKALDTTEIAAFIRQDLRGFDPKSMVLVNRLWWKTFGPYLWENIYIDTNPEQDDRKTRRKMPYIKISGLTHLALSGLTSITEWSNYEAVETYYDDDKNMGHRLVDFACQDTIQSLDVTCLEFCSLEFHELFFNRVQNMSQLKRLRICHRHVQAVRLEETWTDLEDEYSESTRHLEYPHRVFSTGDIIKRRRRNHYFHSVTYADPISWNHGPEGEWSYHSHWMVRFIDQYQDPQLRDEQTEPAESDRYNPDSIDAEDRAARIIPQPFFNTCMYMMHYISEHMASALVRMMPKLKVMALDRQLGVGLRRVKKANDTRIFNEMFKLIFEDEPEVVAPPQLDINALSQDNSLPPSTPSSFLTHPAMYQALDVTEITVLIRQELRGFELKSMVLVNRLWWKTFGPYLWENIYIDADPENDDRQVIFRNGLAARCLTLSIYDPLDCRGVASYVAEKCRNITQLHLKLFSPDLVIIDNKSKQERCGNDPQQIKGNFALKEECETGILDSLFAKLPHVSELTVSFAHEGLQPEVLWCLTKLHRLRKLVIYGGLRAGKYILRKNWKCNWHLLMRVARECQFLESLTVAWESRRVLKLEPEEVSFVGLGEMFGPMATSPEHETTETRISIPVSEQVQSLKWLHISDCEIYCSLLDIVYASCPNLRGIGFKSVKATPIVLEENIEALTSSCPLLRSFEFYDFSMLDDYKKALLEGPLLNLSTLKIDTGIQSAYKFDGLGDLCRGVHSITNLDLSNVYSYRYLMEIMINMTGLTHLKLSGHLYGKVGRSGRHSGYGYVESYFREDRSQELRLPAFACQDTLQFLDVTQLELGSLKFHKLFFDRVQAMPQLRRLEISNRQVQDARIEETWTDPDEDPDLLKRDSFYPDKVIDPRLIVKRRRGNYRHFNFAYAHTKDRERGPEGEELYYHHYWAPPQDNPDQDPDYEATITAAAEAIPDKIFCLFPAVEFLYVYDDDYKRDYSNQEHYISEHIASALVRMMPKLKVMAYDKALGEGLRRVKRTYSNVIFDQIRT
ncbi:hypothetical protein BGX26_008472 [Mortierella sp. AD094]|nr:hypothetical protein BGX26_008472 [Mortierella sp. AD094]